MARTAGVCEPLGRRAFVPPTPVRGQRGKWKLVPKQKLDQFVSVVSDIFFWFIKLQIARAKMRTHFVWAVLLPLRGLRRAPLADAAPRVCVSGDLAHRMSPSPAWETTSPGGRAPHWFGGGWSEGFTDVQNLFQPQGCDSLRESPDLETPRKGHEPRRTSSRPSGKHPWERPARHPPG